MQLIKPRPLQQGDCIGLITPASWVANNRIEEAKTKLREIGFVTHTTDRIKRRYGYLADTDQSRADDINEMFANPDIKAVMCVRGGYGTQRLLHLIDYENIIKNPKILTGYSDITALLQAVHLRTGMVSYHAPMGVSSWNEYTRTMFDKAFVYNQSNITIAPLEHYHRHENKDFRPFVVHDGVAEGQLTGGNLSLLVSLIGTPFQPDFKNKILFVEDIGESPYKIDRMLTHLLNAGILQQVKGIAWGVCKKCDITEEEASHETFTLQQVLHDRLTPLNIPVMYGLPFGHIDDVCTLPIGLHATLDCHKQTLTLNESCCQMLM